MHAAALGAELQVKRVVVPPHSGVFSAWGMCGAEPRADVARTRTVSLADADLGAMFEELEREAVAELAAEAIDPASIRCERAADMRYHGQEHAVRVPVTHTARDAVERDFHAMHRQKYTFDLEGDPVEIVTFHVTAAGAVDPLPTPPAARATSSPTPHGHRRVDFDADGVHEAAVYRRADLPAGFSARGPLVVEDETTTALVHPGQTLGVDEHANLVIDL
jgi:N-methylhydantoinase A